MSFNAPVPRCLVGVFLFFSFVVVVVVVVVVVSFSCYFNVAVAVAAVIACIYCCSDSVGVVTGHLFLVCACVMAYP